MVYSVVLSQEIFIRVMDVLNHHAPELWKELDRLPASGPSLFREPSPEDEPSQLPGDPIGDVLTVNEETGEVEEVEPSED